MTKSLRIAMAAVTAGAAVLSAAAPAAARDHHWKNNHHHDNDGEVAAAAVVAGLLGLAIGAAVSSSKRSPTYVAAADGPLPPPGPAPAVYEPEPAYVDLSAISPPAGVCRTETWTWNRDAQRHVRVVSEAPC